MAGIPNFLLGRHLTAVTLIPQTFVTTGTAAGVFTASTATASLLGNVDEISVDYEADTEEIQSIDNIHKNTVITRKGTSITLAEILKSAGTNLLAGNVAAGDYYQIIIGRGAQSWSAYVVCTGYSEPIRQGKNVGTAKFAPIDIGGTNPNYA